MVGYNLIYFFYAGVYISFIVICSEALLIKEVFHAKSTVIHFNIKTQLVTSVLK